jgi:3-isopropylmalate dehydrogenase
MLLEWLATRHRREDFHRAAGAIEAAVDAALQDPPTRTADLGGALGTRAFAQAVAARLG